MTTHVGNDQEGEDLNNEDEDEQEHFAEAEEEVDEEQFYIPAAESLPRLSSIQDEPLPGDLEWKGSFQVGDPLRAWEESENNEADVEEITEDELSRILSGFVIVLSWTELIVLVAKHPNMRR